MRFLRDAERLTYVLIGCLVLPPVLLIGWKYANRSQAEPAVTTTALSPDGSYLATVLNFNGGGGLSPYCYDLVYITPATDRLDRKRDVVAGGDCRGGDVGSIVKWTSALTLSVNGSLATSGSQFPHKSTDRSNQISVVYMPESGGRF